MPAKYKYGNRKNNKKKNTSKSTKYSKNFGRDSTIGTANTKPRIISIMAYNRSPIWKRRSMVLKYSSYYGSTTVANQSNVTDFLSLGSIYDPNYAMTNTVFSNTTCNGYTELFGNAAGKYTQFRINYTDVKIKAQNCTAGTVAMFVVSATSIGAADYAVTDYIQNIANRNGAIARRLEYFGDSKETIITFRVYPWQVFGVSKRTYYTDTNYIRNFDVNTGTGPFLAFSLGDGAQADGSGGVLLVRGQVWLEHHLTAMNPIEVLAD